MDKHAYLIMAHNNFEILEKLIKREMIYTYILIRKLKILIFITVYVLNLRLFLLREKKYIGEIIVEYNVKSTC